jgi:hypothetical protein
VATAHAEHAIVVDLDDDEEVEELEEEVDEEYDEETEETVTRSAPMAMALPATSHPARTSAPPPPARAPSSIPPRSSAPPQSYVRPAPVAAAVSYTAPVLPRPAPLPRAVAAPVARAVAAPVPRAVSAPYAVPVIHPAPRVTPAYLAQAPHALPRVHAPPSPEVHRRSAPTMPPQNRMPWAGLDPQPARSSRASAAPARPGRTLSPQVRSMSPYEDESIFRPRRRHRSLAALFAFSVLVGAAVALVKLRPDAIPPGVTNAIARARSSSVVQGIERAGSSLLARLPIQHEGHVEPLVPSSVAMAGRVAPSTDTPVPTAAERPSTGWSPAHAAETEAPKSANEPPTVSINALPIAPLPAAAAPRAAPPPPRPRAAPIAAAPPPARAQAPAARPAPAPARPAPAEEQPVAVKPKPAPPPPPAAPPPAPGSLDDLIRKAVEADAKKKH